jgi:NADP-reducing hydrogenase subunit HndD
VNGDPDVNYSLSTRELAQLIKTANIDFDALPEEDFDNPLGESTGAGVIFGTTGGVIEAACRTAYELYTGKKLEKVDFKELRGFENIRHATIDFDGLPINIGIAHGLGNARKLLEDIKEGRSHFHGLSGRMYRGRRTALSSRRFGDPEETCSCTLYRGCWKSHPEIPRKSIHH